jgi:pimeloyl-ACP methyl ester carboxylesterase
MQQNIILLHGALGSKSQFENLKHLLTEEYNVYDFNFDGHGGVPTDQDFSIDLFTANTMDFIRKSGIEKTNLFGYSMGGYVGLNLAKNHPEKIQKMVTLGTKFNWSKETAEKEVRMLNPDKIEEKVPAFAKSLKEIHYPNDWKMIVNKTAQMMLGLAEGKKLAAEDFQKIDQETLIGIGTLDRMVSITESENIVNLLPDGMLKIIEGFEHPIDKIDTKKLASIISDFFE